MGFARVLAGTSFVVVAFALPSRADGGEGWWGDLDKGQSVRLGDVVEAPEAYRGRTITFTCVFHQREREFNPLRTRFNAERYDNVSVWPDGKALWLAGDFEQDFPFLYVARTHAQRDDFLRQETFTRLEVTGRIEAVLDGSPFIEMTSFRVTGHRLGRDVVENMVRAETYARSSELSAKEIAVDNAQAALEDLPDLAPIYATRIRARLAELLKTVGRVSDAERVLRGERLGLAEPEAPGAPGEAAPALLPPGPSFPGTPTDEPAPPGPPGGGSLPGTPIDEPAPMPKEPVRAPPSPVSLQPCESPPLRSPRGEAPEPPLPVDPNAVPASPFSTSLPGVPLDTPAPPVKPAPTPTPAVAPAPAILPPAPVAAPEIVDPPLPAPAPGGKPPPRRPRLAGVK